MKKKTLKLFSKYKRELQRETAIKNEYMFILAHSEEKKYYTLTV